ncbi:MAG: hypothetical protein HC800_13560 [Phormidesmis sp. RL_2_1]|nr:hypothetical protein [Phormidesmis sp. RL_2_1]
MLPTLFVTVRREQWRKAWQLADCREIQALPIHPLVAVTQRVGWSAVDAIEPGNCSEV